MTERDWNTKCHIVSGEDVAADPEKVQAIREWPRSTTVTKVRSFLVLADYYRKFVKEFSSIAKPLTKLTGKGVPFIWEEETEKAFNRLKEALSTATVLALPECLKSKEVGCRFRERSGAIEPRVESSEVSSFGGTNE
ncbi:hypothetical protein N665_0098s0034 [Sinapis alba]|nr:hypothetical protein N665_0098s0034 [Sinapis alba]